MYNEPTLEINSDEIKDYIKEMGYGEDKTALFLLGNLVGRIGTLQYNDRKSKPILNRINYGGMDIRKVTRLYNEVYQAIQYEKMYYTEVELIYSESTRLFGKYKEAWQLSREETLYYILSGYSFSTKQAIINGGKNKNDKSK